jgi:D-alanyl-D-alanine carboxypeptidase/D-alanyl-D-alanine-endopeptidase (penicillin-binding protein 4)
VLTFEPATPWFTLAASVNTVPARSPARIGIERRPGSRILRVFGTVALGAPVSEDLAIDDPAEFAATTLRALLVERGVQVDGVARALHRDGTDTASQAEQAAQPVARFDPALEFSASDDAGLTILRGKALASISSPTLLDDITVTLKVSQNLHAELLLHRLGRAFGEDGSTAQGIRVVRQFWLNAGLNPADFTLFDGSGLSSHDLTTPRAVTQLLTYAARQPWFASFEAALPIGGVDGSLAARFPGPLKGRVFAKTGTLGESRALSGYINTSGGSTLIFSILVDNHLPASAADRAAMDRMVEKLASSP